MSRIVIRPAGSNVFVDEELEEARKAKDDPGSLLFGACPQCSEGDLLVWQREQAVVAQCIVCGYAGALSSVYPWPRPAAERRDAISAWVISLGLARRRPQAQNAEMSLTVHWTTSLTVEALPLVTEAG